MCREMWCKECQHTMKADPEKTLTCPNCGSANLGASTETNAASSETHATPQSDKPANAEMEHRDRHPFARIRKLLGL